jgi:hypothetical protein
MAFPCKNCRDCGVHMDPKYDPSLSSTATAIRCGTPLCRSGSGCSASGQCQYSQSYAGAFVRGCGRGLGGDGSGTVVAVGRY